MSPASLFASYFNKDQYLDMLYVIPQANLLLNHHDSAFKSTFYVDQFKKQKAFIEKNTF